MFVRTLGRSSRSSFLPRSAFPGLVNPLFPNMYKHARMNDNALFKRLVDIAYDTDRGGQHILHFAPGYQNARFAFSLETALPPARRPLPLPPTIAPAAAGGREELTSTPVDVPKPECQVTTKQGDRGMAETADRRGGWGNKRSTRIKTGQIT